MADGNVRLSRRLVRRRRWAGLVLATERGLDAFAPAIGLALAFVGVSLLGWWSHLPWWLHGLALLVVVCAWGWTLERGRRRFRLPTAGDVDRRLERAARLGHRPIESLDDRPAATSDETATRLWAAHQARQRSALARLRFVGLAPVFTRRDPWAVRAAVALVLVVAIVDAGPNWRERLFDAVTPAPAHAEADVPARVDVWVTPPGYTDAAPVVRSYTLPATAAREPVIVPERSELVVQLHDPAAETPPAPRYALAELDTERLGAGSVEARVELTESGALVVPGGGEDGPRLQLDVEVMPDNAPEVAFDGRPTTTQRQALNTRYEAEDDFGLATIALELTLVGREETTERIELRSFARAARDVTEGRYLDLTPHPFAGQEVNARLVARDVVDQQGASETLTFTLPERVFTNPLARAIIALRKQLVAQPGERRSIASKLNILAQSPRLDGLEVAIPLTLRASSTRLVLNDEGEADRSVVDLLWELALYVEDGQFAVAERDLRELQERLREALDRGADAEELNRLMDELQRAMNEFLDAMQRQAMEQLQNLDPRELQEQMRPLDPNARTVDRQDLQAMMEQMREAMEGGAREQAEQMLSQLQQMLENLQTAMQMPQTSPMQQNVGALQELIQRQQDLMDQSFDAQRRQQGQQGQQGQEGSQGQQGRAGQPGSGALGQQQEALRRALGELMRQLGEQGQDIPRALGQGELQMRDAEQALNQGRPGQATGPQGQALDLLQQGAGQLMEQMQQQMGQGQGPGQPGSRTGMGPPLTETRDPLGRPMRNDGGASPYGVEVPERPDLGTAREVLRELQRRSGQSDRPTLELDYLDRLLERF